MRNMLREWLKVPEYSNEHAISLHLKDRISNLLEGELHQLKRDFRVIVREELVAVLEELKTPVSPSTTAVLSPVAEERNRLYTKMRTLFGDYAAVAAKTTAESTVARLTGGEAFIDGIVERIQRKQL